MSWFSVINEAADISLLVLVQIIKATWWIILPVALFVRVKNLYEFKKKREYYESLDWVLLEVSLPPEVEKTPKAMENVLAGLHGVWSPITTRAKFTEGTVADWFSLEIVGIDGRVHFYIRCQRSQRKFVESKVFSQYPDAIIEETEDYMEDLPKDLPNRDYDTWGADFILSRDAAYPIKTYHDFEDIEEERRMDPISQVAELVSKMEEGEHLLLQVLIQPVLTEVEGYADAERNKIIGRKEAQSKGVGQEVAEFIRDIFRAIVGQEIDWSRGGTEGSEGDMMKLTPGEQETLKKIEIKASKLPFLTLVRGVYVARQDVMDKTHIAGLMGVLRQFSDLNSFRPASGTFPSGALIFFKKQRNYLRKKKTFQAYRYRMLGSENSEPYVLGSEEIATLYHLPGRVVQAPFMPRVPSKTAEPPRELPT